MSFVKAVGIPLPREHGAWAMFLVPIALGIGAAGSLSVGSVLFVFTGLAFFLLRYPLVLLLKSRAAEARASALKWSIVFASATLAGGAALLLITHDTQWILLAALGAFSLLVYLWHAARRAEMSLIGEWVGISGLALGAPGAMLAGNGALDKTALALYAVNLLYFGGTVFYVKFKVRQQPKLLKMGMDWRERVRMGMTTLAYHLLAFIAIAVFAAMQLVPWLVPVAFGPVLIKTLSGVVTPPGSRMNIRRLGFIELGVTSLFAGLVLLAYR